VTIPGDHWVTIRHKGTVPHYRRAAEVAVLVFDAHGDERQTASSAAMDSTDNALMSSIAMVGHGRSLPLS
jgi:arginase family enzyme